MPKHVRAADQVGQPWFDKLGRRVMAIRRAAGWSRHKLANETGIVSERRVLEKEYNLRPFSVIELYRISVVLGVPLPKLFEVEKDAEDLWPVPIAEENWYWRVTAPDEKHLLHVYRNMNAWQRRAMLLISYSFQLAHETGTLPAAGERASIGLSWNNPKDAAKYILACADQIWPLLHPEDMPVRPEDDGDEEVAEVPDDSEEEARFVREEERDLTTTRRGTKRAAAETKAAVAETKVAVEEPKAAVEEYEEEDYGADL